jgi:hypothetical protein
MRAEFWYSVPTKQKGRRKSMALRPFFASSRLAIATMKIAHRRRANYSSKPRWSAAGSVIQSHTDPVSPCRSSATRAVVMTSRSFVSA